LNEFTGIGLNTCAENCIAHSPTNPVACKAGAVCPYENLCTGFYFWNEKVNTFVGTSSALAEGYDT